MLVVMENGNVANFLELLFDVEAVRCLDVLKINAAECARNTLHTVDELVRILRVN
jgi:phosphoribosyl-dephospho-CoA transferase